MQILIGYLAALSRFGSKTMDKCIRFLKVLKGRNKLNWTEECEEVLRALKKHLGQAPLLSKPKVREPLLLYPTMTTEVVSSVLISKERDCQLSVCYISKALLVVETQ